MKHKHCPAQLHARHLRGHVRARAKVVGAAAGRRGSLHILACRSCVSLVHSVFHIFIFMLFFFLLLSPPFHTARPRGGKNSSPTYAVCRGAERGAARAGAARRGADRGAALGADLRPIVIPEVVFLKNIVFKEGFDRFFWIYANNYRYSACGWLPCHLVTLCKD